MEDNTEAQRLCLKKVEAFTILFTDDNPVVIKNGVFKSEAVAAEKAKKEGRYEMDGEVVPCLDIWQDANENLYHVIPLGLFTEEAQEIRETLIRSIKRKLTQEEIVFLNLDKVDNHHAN